MRRGLRKAKIKENIKKRFELYTRAVVIAKSVLSIRNTKVVVIERIIPLSSPSRYLHDKITA